MRHTSRTVGRSMNTRRGPSPRVAKGPRPASTTTREVVVMGPRQRALAALVLGGSWCAWAVAAEGPGLTVNSDGLQWPRLQGRVALQTAPAWGGAITGGRSAPSPNSLGLMGDYYVTPSFLGPTRAGGFRATSGIFMGSRGSTWAVPSPSLGNTGSGRERRLFG